MKKTEESWCASSVLLTAWHEAQAFTRKAQKSLFFSNVPESSYKIYKFLTFTCVCVCMHIDGGGGGSFGVLKINKSRSFYCRIRCGQDFKVNMDLTFHTHTSFVLHNFLMRKSVQGLSLTHFTDGEHNAQRVPGTCIQKFCSKLCPLPTLHRVI